MIQYRLPSSAAVSKSIMARSNAAAAVVMPVLPGVGTEEVVVDEAEEECKLELSRLEASEASRE